MKPNSFLLIRSLLWLLAVLPATAVSAVLHSVVTTGQETRPAAAMVPIAAWQGTAVSWRVGVLAGDGALDPLTGVTSLMLTVTSYDGVKPGAFPLIIKSIPAGSFTAPASADGVRAGTEWHVQFDLTAQEMTLPVGDSGTSTYWYEFRAISKKGGAVLRAGQLLVRGTSSRPDSLNTTPRDPAGKKTRFAAATVAALRALPPSSAQSGDMAAVDGYRSAGDGGQGQFSWDADSAEADDGGLVIAPAGGGTGRWKRDFTPGQIRAAWFGARPGVAADQTELIKLAMAKTGATGGGVCQLDAGTFRIAGTLYVPDRVNLRGQGKRVTILQQTPNLTQSQSRAIIDLGDPDYNATSLVRRKISISGISFDLFNNPGAKGIRVRWATDDVTVEDCECWLSDVENGNPRTSEPNNRGDRHFIDMSVTGPTPTDGGSWTLPDGHGVFSLKIFRCHVHHGVQLTSNAGRGVSGLWVDSCQVEDPVAYGLAITSVTSNGDFIIENVRITNCMFKNVGSAVLLGRDQTAQGNVIQMYPRIQQMRNITITGNQIVLGGQYYLPISTAISVSTYQSYCRNIKIYGNTISTQDGVLPQELKGIQVVSYDSNWLSDLMGGAAPVIASVDPAAGTITTSKPARLYDEMSVRFERSDAGDVLPSPLVENRRYRIINGNPIVTVLDAEGNITTADTNTTYKLADMRSGAVINLASTGRGAVKVIYSPCVEDFDIQGNTVSGVSEGIYLTDGFNGRIQNNIIRGGNVRSTPSGLLEEVTFSGNKLSRGTYQFEGRVHAGVLRGEQYRVRDDELGISNVAAFNFSPAQAFAAQAWEIDDNTVEMTRGDGNSIGRLTAAFRCGGAGQVRIGSLKRNGISPTIARPFEDLSGAMVQGIRDNYILPAEDAAFAATPASTLARVIADAKVDNGLREAQADIGLTGRAPIEGGIFFDGTPGNQQATATLTGINLGTEGRGLTWRHRVSASNAIGGLWALTGSGITGHAAGALYAFESNGTITIRQVGAAPGTLDADTGKVTGGDYRQVTFDASGRRGLPAHFSLGIDRAGAVNVWMEGLPVKLTETTSGMFPAWNSPLKANPTLNVAYVDASAGTSSLPGFKGAFYSLAVLNFAPADSQAQALFAGGINALPEYGLRNPADNVLSGGFADAANWSASGGVTIRGGTCNFLNAAPGAGVMRTAVPFQKGRMYRLGINVLSCTSGQLHVPIGSSSFRSAWRTSPGLTVFEGAIPDGNNSFAIRASEDSTTLSIDDVSMVPIGAVASYNFDAGLGYQIEDNAGLANHLRVNTAGVYHLARKYSARWTGRLTASGTFLGGRTMEVPGHVITKISAYSASGGSFRLGDSSGTPGTLVAAMPLPAATWTDLTLLKNSTTDGAIYADLITASDLQIVTEYSVPRLIN